MCKAVNRKRMGSDEDGGALGYVCSHLRKVLELCVCVTLAASSILTPVLTIPWNTWRILIILLVLEWRTGQSPGGS